MSRLQGVDIDYLDRKFRKGDKRRGEAMVLLALAREEGKKNIRDKFVNLGLIIVGYILSSMLLIMGFLTSLFFSFIGLCLLGATIYHHIWYYKINDINKNYGL